MNDVYELQISKNKYLNLRENLSYIIGYLDSANESLYSTPTKFFNSYNADDYSYGKEKINSLRTSLQEISNYLGNTIIPNINAVLQQKSAEIEEKERDLLI